MARLTEVLARLEEEAKREHLPIIGPAKAAFLGGLVRDVQPTRAVEVGTLAGYATLVIAAALPTGTRLDSLELNQAMLDRAGRNLKEARLVSRVRLHLGDAQELLSQLSGPIDFVFLDGQRSQAASYLRQLSSALDPSAVVVANGRLADSAMGDGYLDWLAEGHDWRTELVNFGDEAMAVSWRID
jgi:predicted O-methyltransferase YrrM